MNPVVLYCYQGVVSDAEQLFDAVFGELCVVVRGQPCLIVGDFNVEPTKIPCLAKRISAGHWVDMEAVWAPASGVQPAVTCKRTLDSTGCRRRDFVVGCPLAAAAAVSSCWVEPAKWIVPHLVRAHFDCGRWSCKATQPVQRTSLRPASWLPVRSRGSKSGEVQRVREIYDDRLQFISGDDPVLLSNTLRDGDVSRAWLVWSGAAETAPADAYRFSGGSMPVRGLVSGRGTARFRVVKLGGPGDREARSSVADVHEAAGVFMYRDSSFAPLLDLRPRIRAVMDVLDAIIRNGISLARSVELTAQWVRS